MTGFYTYSPLWSVIEAITNEIDNAAEPEAKQSRRRHCNSYSTCGRGYGSRGNCKRQYETTDQEASKNEVRIAPPVDVYDTPKSFLLTASIAGASPDAIEVDYDTKTSELSISGVIPKTKGQDLHKYVKIGERKFGRFARKVKLPVDSKIDEDSIRATYVNGVLQVTIPKVEPLVKEKKKIVVSINDEDDDQETIAETLEETEEKGDVAEETVPEETVADVEAVVTDNASSSVDSVENRVEDNDVSSTDSNLSEQDDVVLVEAPTNED